MSSVPQAQACKEGNAQSKTQLLGLCGGSKAGRYSAHH